MVLYAAPVLPRPAEVASAVGDARSGADKPVIATFLGSEPGDEVDGVQPGLPIFRFPSEGARTLGRLAAYGEWLGRPAGTLPMPDEIGLDVAAVQARVAEVLATDPEGRTLEHAEAADLLALAGLPACPSALVHGPDEAVAAAQAMGYPVVLKASGVGRYHRGEVGGVALDLHDDEALRAAFGRMVTTLRSAMEPAIVQKAAPAGADVLVAGQQHPTFGGVVTVGLGGAAAAANADLPVRVLPISDTDASELVAASQVEGLLSGPEAGGRASVASGELAALLVRFAALLEHVPELAGVLANPVIVGPDGTSITDAWVRVAPYRVPSSPEVRRLDGAPGLFLGL